MDSLRVLYYRRYLFCIDCLTIIFFCKDNQLPYDEGYDMRLAGIEPEGNPYDIYTEEHGEWERGYVHAGIDQDRE